MANYAEIERTVLRSVAEVNTQSPPHEQAELNGQGLLAAPMGPYDSLAIISLMFAVEKNLEADMGVKLSLSSLLAEPGQKDPFVRVDSLVSWLEPRIHARAA